MSIGVRDVDDSAGRARLVGVTDLEQVRARALAASEGPWKRHGSDVWLIGPSGPLFTGRDGSAASTLAADSSYGVGVRDGCGLLDAAVARPARKDLDGSPRRPHGPIGGTASGAVRRWRKTARVRSRGMGQDLAFYRDLVDNMSDGVYFVDRTRTITYWSRGAERLTGYHASEVVGRRCRDGILNHVDECGTELCGAGCPLKATIRDGRCRDAHVFMHHADGHRQPVWVRAAPLRDPAGEISGAARTQTGWR